MIRAIAIAAATAVLVPVLLVGAVVGALTDTAGSIVPDIANNAADGATALFGDVPDTMAGLYDTAASVFGISAGLLAGVGKVECDHNRNPACAEPNPAGAVGPMQFLPATFARWSYASGAAAPSILDPRDAVYAAAAKLAADGAATNPRAALLAYNHSDTYVAVVLGWALRYGWTPPADGAALLADAVRSHPRLHLRPDAAADIASGDTDPRVLAALLALATAHDLGSVGPIRTGHSRYVAGTTRVSNHYYGRAVDIAVIDGAPVSAANPAAADAATLALALPGALRPDEVGSPFAIAAPGAFTDADHQDHLHLGWGAAGDAEAV